MLSLIAATVLFLPQASPEEQKLTPELREVLAVAPAEHHRVYAVFDSRLGLDHFQGRVEALPRGDRQRLVMQELRAWADQEQAAALELLQRLEAEGHAGNVVQLWINNCLRFEGDAVAVRAIAGLDKVLRVNYDPVRDPMELADIPLRPPAPPQNPAATSYYYTGFESGTTGPEWSGSVTGCGRIQVTSAFSPFAGNYHMVMDSDTNNCSSTATAVLTVDLSAATTAQLRFQFIDFNDEFNLGSDIVEASDDGGLTWVKVGDLTGSDMVYVTKTFDLDATGLSYVANFMIRFRWSDNYSATVDGFGFDEIEIADSFPPPPPPPPEPNLVKHQAPDLWALGVDGTGAVILNIDSGVDRFHPDLSNRIWVNPYDPINGLDDDGNGYVDDWWGWNFELNNNDPSPGISHGTNTAGIMVGDGSSGVRLTGMAPGAKLAACRIGSESDHWAAQQWGISVGVDCNSSSYSYKWPFSPRPDYHMHRATTDMVLAAGIIHANSIGNQGTQLGTYPIPFNISAPGNSPGPWRHPQQVQSGGVSSVLGCCGIQLPDDQYYNLSGKGPSAWEDIRIYDAGYPHTQDPNYWDYPYGGWGGGQPGLLKPDIAGYTDGPYTTTPGGGYTTFSGTSCATPHVGGAMALMVSANPNALPRQISQALQENAEDRGAAGKDTQWGAGKMLVKDAALRLMHLVTADDLTPNLGQTLTLTISGPPGENFQLYVGKKLGTTTIPGIGDLEIANARLFATGTLDAAGLATVIGTVPNYPPLSGQSLYAQSVCDDTGGATSQWLFSLVEKVDVQ